MTIIICEPLIIVQPAGLAHRISHSGNSFDGKAHDSAIFRVNNLTVSPAEYSPQVSLRGAC